MGKRLTIPLNILKGKWSAASGTSGDPSLMPDGYCIECRNVVVRANRLETRPPFVYDNIMSPRGLTSFDDQTNKCSRLMAVDSSQAIYEKATSGDTWSASKGTLSGTRLTDACNYRGKLYGMMDDGAGLPTAAFSFDGANLSTAPFNSAIQSRCVTAYLDRVFLAYPRVTVTPVSNTGAFDGYNFETWNQGVVTTRVLVSGGRTVRRVTPTAGGVGLGGFTVGSQINSSMYFQATASSTSDTYVWRQDFLPVDYNYAIPMYVGVIATNMTSARLTAYTQGQVVVESDGTNFNVYRCSTAGTTAAGAPAWGTLGTTTNDGTVVWAAESLARLGYVEFTVPNASGGVAKSTISLRFTVPWRTNTMNLQVVIGFGWSTQVLAQVAPVDLSIKDGLGDTDPAKANMGGQMTKGEFIYPFYNKESASTATVDLKSIVWSEVLQPTRVRASATYEPQEVNGYPTAATTLGGRYLVFFRDGFIQFSGNPEITSLDVIPIRRERQYKGVGCIGPRAHDQFEDVLYFIGEDGIYRMTVGSEHPQEIGGDAMREEIMSRGSNWIESQATYNMPLLRIDKRNREVWVYTQKGTIYIYNIQSGAWTNFDVANSAEIADFYFNANTRKMYVAVGGQGLARVDWSAAAAQDTVESTLTNYSVTKDVIPKPLEFSPHADVCVERIAPFHLATASQTSQTLTAYVSFDRGATYPYTDQITLDTTVPRNPIELYELAPSVTLKLSHVGKAGATIWAVSKIDAEIQVMSGEYPQVIPAGTATL